MLIKNYKEERRTLYICNDDTPNDENKSIITNHKEEHYTLVMILFEDKNLSRIISVMEKSFVYLQKSIYFLKVCDIYYKKTMIKGKTHTKETREKIAETMRRYYANETAEQRQIRIARLTERKRIEKQLYEKYLQDLKLFER